MSGDGAINENESTVLPYPQESLLVDAVAEMASWKIEAGRVLCTSAGFAQFALAAARAMPESAIHCTYLDLYRANLALVRSSVSCSGIHSVGGSSDIRFRRRD
jgi:hypothetical protein